jgi:glycosyltransferase involved in cell wall biosynthesis
MKLLLIGVGTSHLRNYYELICRDVDQIMIVTDRPVDFCEHRVLNFQLRNPFLLRKSIQSLRAMIASYKPDVIHVHQLNSYGFITAMANKKSVPMIATAWGSDVLILPQRNFLFKKMVGKVIHAADVITADAKYLADVIQQVYRRSDVEVLNFGINPDEFENKDNAKQNLLYSNRLHKALYNIDKIIMGSADFLRNNKDWRLVIAADGELNKTLKALVKELELEKQIEFVGFLNKDENRKYYLESRIYISIPGSDGTSVSLLEAMASGCIPLVSDLPANKEWITNGSNGIIIQADQLNDALQGALKMDAGEVAKNNRAIIQERASKQINRQKFLKLYQKLVNANSN